MMRVHASRRFGFIGRSAALYLEIDRSRVLTCRLVRGGCSRMGPMMRSSWTPQFHYHNDWYRQDQSKSTVRPATTV